MIKNNKIILIIIWAVLITLLVTGLLIKPTFLPDTCYSLNDNEAVVVTVATPGDAVSRSFIMPCDIIDSIAVKIGTYARQNDSIWELSLFDASGETIYSGCFNAQNLSDNQYYQHKFDHKIAVHKGDSYTLTITAINVNTGTAIAFYSLSDGSPCMQVYGNRFVLWRLFVILSFIYFAVALAINTHNKGTNSNLLLCIGVFFILFSVVHYIVGVLKDYNIKDTMVLSWIVGVSAIAITIIGYFIEKKNRYVASVVFFIALFFIYSLRCPEDLFSSYLWCEDGIVLLNQPISEGISSLTIPGSGAYWTIQRLIGLLCYGTSYLLNDLSFFPALMGFITKLIATSSVFYFTTDRFNWIVKNKSYRFAICAGIMFAIPKSSIDVISCDTSLPFVMLFFGILVVIDTLGNDKPRTITIVESAFLTILALSTIASPFIGAIAVLAFLRKLIATKKVNSLDVCKTIPVIIATSIQLLYSISSPRSQGIELALIRRLLICINDMVFYPYSSSYTSKFCWGLAFGTMIIMAIISRIPWKIPVLCLLSSFSFLCFCSMTTPPESITVNIFAPIGGRYVMLSYMIAVFLLGIEAFRLWDNEPIRKTISIVLFGSILLTSILTYHIDFIGDYFSDTYSQNIEAYDRSGNNTLIIQIGPWVNYAVSIPCNIDNEAVDYDAEYSIVDSQLIYDFPDDKYLTQYSGYIESYNGEVFNHIALRLNDGTYLAPLVSEQNEDSYYFEFCVDDNSIDNDLQIVGYSTE